mmetsp:Transcript_38651/g.110547  ORF Transcript_38651/g.110547 Transcript_38651/m.110547 type:complete len:81 (+) Transcript_38651:14-256(+)
MDFIDGHPLDDVNAYIRTEIGPLTACHGLHPPVHLLYTDSMPTTDTNHRHKHTCLCVCVYVCVYLCTDARAMHTRPFSAA